MEAKDWFASWFDTPYYHILYKERNDTEAQAFLDKLMQNLALAEGDKILDVACGKGRHSIYMASKGFEVTGIDLSEQSILHGRKFETEKLSFFQHDMRLPFRINYFNCAVNLFTSLGYFDDYTDNEKAIKATALNLKKGGKLVIDFFNATKVQACLVPFLTKDIDGIRFSISKKIENKKVVKTIQFTDNNQDYEFFESVSLLSLADFTQMLTAAGLSIKSTFGNYALEDFNPKDSERLILVAQK